jgi:ketosteroid isomerase-like protein
VSDEDIVEIARGAYEAGTRRPKPDLATVNVLYHPDHELVTPLSRLEGTSYRGAAGFREWFTSRPDDWDSMTFRLDEARAIDESRVLLATTFTGHSRRGGVPVVQEQGLVMTVRDGKVTRTEAYNSVDEAPSAVSGRP